MIYSGIDGQYLKLLQSIRNPENVEVWRKAVTFFENVGMLDPQIRINFLRSLHDSSWNELIDPTCNQYGVTIPRGFNGKFQSVSQGGVDVPGVAVIPSVLGIAMIDSIRMKVGKYLESAPRKPGTVGPGSEKATVKSVYGHGEGNKTVPERQHATFNEVETMISKVLGESPAVRDYLRRRQIDSDRVFFGGGGTYYTSIGLVEYVGDDSSRLEYHLDSVNAGGLAVVITLENGQSGQPSIFYSKSNLKRKDERGDEVGLSSSLGDVCIILAGREHRTNTFEFKRVVLFVFYNVTRGDKGAWPRY